MVVILHIKNIQTTLKNLVRNPINTNWAISNLQ